MFKNIHPHQGDGHSNHHHRGILKSGNVQTIDAATKRHLQSLNKKYFPDYSELVKNEASFRKEFHSYLKEAEALQIPIEDAINVHKKAVVVQARASRKDCTGGQFPWVIMLVNSSEDFSTRIFSAGAYVDGKKCMRNNAFAITGNVREAKHFKTMGDFIASAYMNGHMNGHGPMVSFEPVIFTFDSNDEKSGNFGKKFELAALRREKYLKDWKAAGFEATIPGNDKTAERTTDTPAGSHTTLVPIIMHDITNCVYYALEDGKKIELEKWLRDRGLLEREGVSNLIESLGEHRKEKDYFESLVQMMRYKKTLGCVDSRWYRVDSSTIKLLGGIATDGERKRILETPGIKNVTVCLHFGCGYLQTAMALHEFGSEINRIFDSGIANGKAREVKIARAFFSVGIQSIINAKSTRFDLTRFLNMVESVNDGKGISSDSKHFIEKLFQSGLSDTRNTLQHMAERGVLKWDDHLGTMVMVSAAELDRKLGENHHLLAHMRNEKDESTARTLKQEYYHSITLSEAMRQEELWHRALVELNSKVKVKLQVEDFKTGISYSTTDGIGMRDSVTGQKVT